MNSIDPNITAAEPIYQALWDELEKTIEGDIKEQLIAGKLKNPVNALAIAHFRSVKFEALKQLNEMRSSMSYGDWMGHANRLTAQLEGLVKSAQASQGVFEKEQATLKGQFTSINDADIFKAAFEETDIEAIGRGVGQGLHNIRKMFSIDTVRGAATLVEDVSRVSFAFIPQDPESLKESREHLSDLKTGIKGEVDRFISGGRTDRLALIAEYATGMLLPGTLVKSAIKIRGIAKLPKIIAPDQRYCYAEKYGKYDAAFRKVPREFNGVLSKDLTVVRFSANTGNIGAWWMPAAEANSLSTMEAVTDRAAFLSRFGEKSHVTVARIPAGEPVKFRYGRAASQIDVLTGEIKQGGVVQYQFYDFAQKWIQETRPLP